eukprot:tig00021037_g17419.t1
MAALLRAIGDVFGAGEAAPALSPRSLAAGPGQGSRAMRRRGSDPDGRDAAADALAARLPPDLLHTFHAVLPDFVVLRPAPPPARTPRERSRERRPRRAQLVDPSILDAHGEIRVSRIDSDRLLIHTVGRELERRKKAGTYKGDFQAVPPPGAARPPGAADRDLEFRPRAHAQTPHFLGYEGRCGMPSNFDADLCYSLAFAAGALLEGNFSGPPRPAPPSPPDPTLELYRTLLTAFRGRLAGVMATVREREIARRPRPLTSSHSGLGLGIGRAQVRNVAAGVDDWRLGAVRTRPPRRRLATRSIAKAPGPGRARAQVPLTSMLGFEHRRGRDVPAIRCAPALDLA